MPLFLYFLILTGFIFTKGFFSLSGALLILAAVVIFFFFLLNKNYFHPKELLSSQSLFSLLCLFSILLYGGLYQKNVLLVFLSYGLLFLNLLLALRLVSSTQKGEQARIYFFLIVIALLVRVFMIWSSPDPYIDVYDYLKKGAQALLSGQNPYSLTYTKFYTNFTPNYYGYLPGMLFITLPFVAIFQDPRYTFVFAEIAVALIILKWTADKKEKYLYSLLFLNNPVSLYLVEESYTEPLILLFLILSVWLFARRRFFPAALVFGLALATKQYVILQLPLFFRIFSGGLKEKAIRTLGAVITALLITAPFILWNSSDFFEDAVFLQNTFSPRYEGLSFFALLYRFGIGYNFLVSSSIMGLGFVFVYLQKKVDPARFFYLSSFLYFVFFFFNKWAFINYYYLISQLLLAGIVLDKKTH